MDSKLDFHPRLFSALKNYSKENLWPISWPEL